MDRTGRKCLLCKSKINKSSSWLTLHSLTKRIFDGLSSHTNETIKGCWIWSWRLLEVVKTWMECLRHYIIVWFGENTEQTVNAIPSQVISFMAAETYFACSWNSFWDRNLVCVGKRRVCFRSEKITKMFANSGRQMLVFPSWFMFCMCWTFFNFPFH